MTTDADAISNADARLAAIADYFRRRVSGGGVRIPCPAHGGVKDNLALWVDPQGGQRIGAKCWSDGCAYRDIAEAIERQTGIRLTPFTKAAPRPRWQIQRPATRPAERPGDGPPAPVPPPAPPPPKQASQPAPGQDADTARRNLAWARRLFESAVAFPGPEKAHHPARRWLADRSLWRTEFPAPAGLRWIPADAYTGEGKGAPTELAGMILAPMASPQAWADAWPGIPDAEMFQIIAIDGAGQKCRIWNGADKRTHALTNERSPDLVFCIGNPEPASTAPTVVTEGVADCLALAARFENFSLCCIGVNPQRKGRSSLSNTLGPWLARRRRHVLVYADRDEAGRDAAGNLQSFVRGYDGTCVVVYARNGKDAAAAAQAAGFPPVDIGPDSVFTDYGRALRMSQPDWPRYYTYLLAEFETKPHEADTEYLTDAPVSVLAGASDELG